VARAHGNTADDGGHGLPTHEGRHGREYNLAPSSRSG
jgi:hypothetical protein